MIARFGLSLDELVVEMPANEDGTLGVADLRKALVAAVQAITNEELLDMLDTAIGDGVVEYFDDVQAARDDIAVDAMRDGAS